MKGEKDMSTTFIHTRIGVIDAAGNTSVLYPQNTGRDVYINTTENENIPNGVMETFALKSVPDAIQVKLKEKR